MGFLDKVKASAEQAVKQGQDMLDDAQSKRKADALLRELGAWHYAAATGRDEGKAADEIARVTAALEAHEAANGPIELFKQEEAAPPPPPPPPPPGGTVSPPPPPTSPPPPTGTVSPPPPTGGNG